MAEFRCYRLLHAGEGPRADHVDVMCTNNRAEAAEEAADYFDMCEQMKERCGHDAFDGGTHHIEVVSDDGQSTKHEVVCEVKRVYTAILR